MAVCGDGEYIIYTAMALRNKTYGPGVQFVWASDSSMYAVRQADNSVKIFKNFKEHQTLKPGSGVKNIYGGRLLGVSSEGSLALYDWDTTELVRRIETSVINVYWSDAGDLVCLSTREAFFILRFKPEVVEDARGTVGGLGEDGVEEAFEVESETSELVCTGLWVGDCFLYTSNLHRLSYSVAGEIVSISHLDRQMYLLGYMPKENRLYLGDRSLNIISFYLNVSLLEYQTAVMRNDLATADSILPLVPKELRSRVAHFLEKQGYRKQAMAVTPDSDHQFDLATQLGDLKTVYSLARQADSVEKWSIVSGMAIQRCEFGLAQESLFKAGDFGGIMLLATSAGNRQIVEKLAESAKKAGQNNVAFLANFILGRCDACLEILIHTDRIAEAAFFARTYIPSQISRVVTLWKERLVRENRRSADALAEPSKYANLFPLMSDSLKTEQYLAQTSTVHPSTAYNKIPGTEDWDPVAEMREAERAGEFVYSPPEISSQNEHLTQEIPRALPSEILRGGKGKSQGSHQHRLPCDTQPTAPSNRNSHLACQKTLKTAVAPGEKGSQDTENVSSGEATGQEIMKEVEKELGIDLDGVDIDDFDMDNINLDIEDEDLLQD